MLLLFIFLFQNQKKIKAHLPEYVDSRYQCNLQVNKLLDQSYY